MIVNPFKVFLFVAGGSAAAATTAYVSGALDPYLYAAPPAQIAAVPAEPPKTEPAPPATATPPVAETPPAATPPATAETPAPPPADAPATPPPAAAEAPAATPPAAEPKPAPAAEAPAVQPPQDVASAEPAPPPPPTAAPEVIAPSFDLVRVEANGSIVIAGKAAPNAKVEALTGSKVIGTADAGPEGDFAIILEDPLKPGDYQIVLRSVAPGNVVAMSVETAIVSIPTNAGGQVLAMVEEPGKPAELITVPQPEAPKPAEPAPPAAAEQPATPPVAAAPAEQPPAAEPVTPAPAAGPKVVVEAVEIEGRKIFVAGSADAGRLVRAYANEILLGDARTSEGGRFLIEAQRDLPVGDYIIRVDALEPNGEKVVARAAVPFEREPGEAIAAVAPPAVESAPAQPAPPQTDVAAAEPVPAPAEAAPPAAQPPAAAEPPPPATQPPTAAEATLPAADPPATAQPPAVADAPQPPAAQPPAAAEATPPPAATPPAAAEVTPPATDAKPAPADVAAAPPADQPPETTAPKLQPSASGVIIRRGDNLWRISRRVYGFGTRYSTLYLANQDQIRDPNKIWPGQVFKVPEKSKEGEAADMKAMGDQMMPVQ